MNATLLSIVKDKMALYGYGWDNALQESESAAELNVILLDFAREIVQECADKVRQMSYDASDDEWDRAIRYAADTLLDELLEDG